LTTGTRIALVYPGWITLLYLLLCYVLLFVLCYPLNNGPRILHSDPSLITSYPSHPEERWIFINGICAGTQLLQENVDLISAIFRRPVMGVHNRTYGPIMDLLECMAQRDFGYMSDDIRTAYNAIKTTLLLSDVDKVVLLAHSQGGIIVAAAVDALCADLPPAAFQKLEIYTFGCAANHFSNPPRCVHVTTSGMCPQCLREANGSETTLSGYPTSNKRQIPVIEHYANGRDFVANLGVLCFVRRPKENEFVGKVFTDVKRGGHLFCQHYLEPMFSGDSRFLEEVVVVDEAVAVRRAADEMGPQGAINGVRQSDDAHGKTVRELSRLWWYKDGGTPPPKRRASVESA
jgi:hypothetical protein